MLKDLVGEGRNQRERHSCFHRGAFQLLGRQSWWQQVSSTTDVATGVAGSSGTFSPPGSTKWAEWNDRVISKDAGDRKQTQRGASSRESTEGGNWEQQGTGSRKRVRRQSICPSYFPTVTYITVVSIFSWEKNQKQDHNFLVLRTQVRAPHQYLNTLLSYYQFGYRSKTH